MNRQIWAIIGLIFLGVLVFGAGIVTGQTWGTAVAWQPGFGMMANNTSMINGNIMGNQAGMMDGNMMSHHASMMGGSGMMNGNMMNHHASMMGNSDMMNGNMMSHHASMMGDSGMMNGNMMGMMGSANADAEITVTTEEAVPLAQEYLDANLSGSTIGDEVDACPGMVAFQVERDGEILGMIGVNAYTGQVFLHQ